ncbi:MAG: gcvH [Herbinix sp.]|jgi:glycine cleavage system H protein|nr:gcvH [Herbinix sp.]
MSKLEGLKFTKSHEWIEFLGGDKARIGITEYAQEALGDLVFINLPEVGDDVTLDESFADVESVKAVSEVISPVSGVVAAINEELLDSPELINQSAFDAWLVEVSDITEQGELLSADEYEAFIKEEE